MLKLAVRWDNGMVMAFDENGEQITELQGPFEDVAAVVPGYTNLRGFHDEPRRWPELMDATRSTARVS